MSINLDCASFLTINCVQVLPVPENELEIVSATNQCTSVEPDSEGGDTKTDSKAAVRGSVHILPYRYL